MTRDGDDVQINGKAFDRAYRETHSCFGCGDVKTATIDVNVGRRFRLVTARLGLDDRAAGPTSPCGSKSWPTA